MRVRRRARTSDDRGGDAVAGARSVTTAHGSAYAALPPRQQTLLWYAEVERLAPSDIAVLLGTTTEAVETEIRAARDAFWRTATGSIRTGSESSARSA